MADDYDTMRDELTEIGPEASQVFNTILSRPEETADYKTIEKRLSVYDFAERDALRVTHELLERDYLEKTDGGLTVTAKTERFLDEDIDDLDDYRQSLKMGTAFQKANEYVDETLPYDLDAEYDTDAMADAMDTEEALNLLADVLAHPQYAPSTDELDYLDPETDREDIVERYDNLADQDVTVTATDGEHTFHRLTDAAVAYMADEGILGTPPGTAVGTWQGIHLMVEKPPDIETLQWEERPVELWD